MGHELRQPAQVAAADLDDLVLTPGYERLLSVAGTMTGTDTPTQRVLNGMVRLELTQRVDAFGAAVKDLDTQIGRWAVPGPFVVADTSFYIEHPDKLEDVDFRPLLKIWEDPVRLLVPIVVIDELDGLKKSKTTQECRRARSLSPDRPACRLDFLLGPSRICHNGCRVTHS